MLPCSTAAGLGGKGLPLNSAPSLPPLPPLPRSCTALQELRLNHNKLRALPADLAANTRLRILDCGGNQIASFDDIEVGRWEEQGMKRFCHAQLGAAARPASGWMLASEAFGTSVRVAVPLFARKRFKLARLSCHGARPVSVLQQPAGSIPALALPCRLPDDPPATSPCFHRRSSYALTPLAAIHSSCHTPKLSPACPAFPPPAAASQVLSRLPQLRSVSFKGCPIAGLPDYREKLQALVPRLEILDNARIAERPRKQLPNAAAADAAAEGGSGKDAAANGRPAKTQQREEEQQPRQRREREQHGEQAPQRQQQERQDKKRPQAEAAPVAKREHTEGKHAQQTAAPQRPQQQEQGEQRAAKKSKHTGAAQAADAAETADKSKHQPEKKRKAAVEQQPVSEPEQQEEGEAQQGGEPHKKKRKRRSSKYGKARAEGQEPGSPTAAQMAEAAAAAAALPKPKPPSQPVQQQQAKQAAYDSDDDAADAAELLRRPAKQQLNAKQTGVWPGTRGGTVQLMCACGCMHTHVPPVSITALPCHCFCAGVVKVIDLKSGKQGKGKGKAGGKDGKAKAAAAAVTGAQALKALLQPAAADVGGGAGLSAWD